MSLFTKLVKKSVKDFLHRRKKWIIAMMVFLAVLIGTNYLLNHYVGKVVGTLIKEFVYEKSDGFYQADFQEIAYILNSGTFHMGEFQFEIHPDYKQDLDYDELPQHYIYTSSIPSLNIDIVDFWSIFVQRKLKVIGIEITSPYIKIINLNKTKTPKKLSFEAGNLYSILSGHLNELKINDFLITDGEFDYETYQGAEYDNFKIKGLTFEVNNFSLSEKSSTRKDKIFYTDDIFLEIKDQVLFLKDSIHKVTFDKFYISTNDNEFGFENFNLTQQENPDAKVKDYDHFEINLPSLRMSGIDFLNAYNNNLLVIDSISIPKPMINIRKRTKGQHKDSTRNNLLNVAMIFHDYLMINHFYLEDANLIFTDERNEIPKQYIVDHISANITKVEIDTISHSKYQYGFNFEDIDLVIKEYEVMLPDSINSVRFEEFSISSNPVEIKLKDLSLNPRRTPGATSKNNVLEATIPYLVIKDFDVAQAINTDTFLIDEIYLENADIKVVQLNRQQKIEGSEQSTGGLFGVYEIIQNNSRQFILNRLNIIDGKFVLESAIEEDSINLYFDKINVAFENMTVDSLTNTETDLLGHMTVDVALDESHVHTRDFTTRSDHMAYNSQSERFEINNMYIDANVNAISDSLRLQVPELVITGIKPNEILYSNIISLDTLKFQDVDVFMDLMEVNLKEQEQNEHPDQDPPTIRIAHLLGIDYDVRIDDKGSPLFTADNINFDISDLLIDQTLSDNPFNQFDYEEVNLISVDQYELLLKKQQHLFKTNKILWDNASSTFSIEDISLRPVAAPNNKYQIDIPKITMTGINLKKVLKESYYVGEEVIIDRPRINLKLARGRQQKLTSLDLGFIPLLLRNRYHGMKSNTFEVRNASVNVHQQAEEDSLIIEGESFNLFVDKFEVDSTTEMVPDRFLFANDVRFSGEYLSAYDQKNSNFFNINQYDISTREGNVNLRGIYFATNTRNTSLDKGHLRLSIDNLRLVDIDFFDLTQHRTLEMNTIQIDNADLLIEKIKPVNQAMTAVDSLEAELKKYYLTRLEKKEDLKEEEVLQDIVKSLEQQLQRERDLVVRGKKGEGLDRPEYLFDTLLLQSTKIDKILLTDSKLEYKTTDDPNTGLLVPDIWLLAEGVKYDPVAAKDSSRIFYSDNMMAKLRNIKYVLPDNLSSIAINELSLNSRDSTMKANNFALIPLVDMYDYGIAKGYQSTWLKLENDSVSLNNIDFLGLLNQQKLNASSLNVHNAEINVFRDKRVPFPEWQRRPLPQTDLRRIGFTFGIDTINLIDGFITYQEHAEQAYTTGEVYFTDVDAKIINLTNDSVKMIEAPHAKIGVTAKVFDKGAIKGEFLFDLVNKNNIHTYGIDVSPFDLTEFNRIMIPTASVQITSGTNNRIIMTAKANEDYSYGEMKFYYDDLKIQLLNRETETPKGLGNALGSFFANTFIIKSNNPKNLILRKGDIFYERDKKRAIFNYWTKTFLSGVVSSIGAANNKKKIKKMQKDNLKELQKEKQDNSP